MKLRLLMNYLYFIAGFSILCLFCSRVLAAEPKLIATLKGHSDSIEALAFSPDGKILASGSKDNTLRLWDTAKGREERKVRAPVHPPPLCTLIVHLDQDASIE
jgi:WD40 repeat protein